MSTPREGASRGGPNRLTWAVVWETRLCGSYAFRMRDFWLHDHFTHAITSLYLSCCRSFGFTDLAALNQGRHGNDCRGEEHVVELVWSVKSGKTRVYWNKRHISHLFRNGNRSGVVEFAWKAQSGESFQIVAHSEARPGVIQYDLRVDGTSFFTLPGVSQLGLPESRVDSEELQQGGLQRIDSVSALSTMSDIPLGDALEEPFPEEALGFRLSMAGLNSGLEDDAIVDELHSDLYSPVLESLRQQITKCLPQTEEMVSRAIINAFFCDSDSQQSLDRSLSDASMELDPYQIEADAVLEAYEWVGLNVDYAPRPDAEEQAALSFMQKQIDAIFLHIRNDKLSSDAASRVLLSVGAVLGLKFVNSIPVNTIILDGLAFNTTREDLHRVLCCYGELDCAAVAKRRGFALCRFSDEESIARVLEDAQMDCLMIAGATPSVIVLSEDSHDGLPQQLRSRNEDKITEDPTDSNPHVIVGTPTPVPHLMASLSSDACGFEDATDHTCITPDYSESYSTRHCFGGNRSCSPTSSATSELYFSKIVSPDTVTRILSERVLSEHFCTTIDY